MRYLYSEGVVTFSHFHEFSFNILHGGVWLEPATSRSRIRLSTEPPRTTIKMHLRWALHDKSLHLLNALLIYSERTRTLLKHVFKSAPLWAPAGGPLHIESPLSCVCWHTDCLHGLAPCYLSPGCSSLMSVTGLKQSSFSTRDHTFRLAIAFSCCLWHTGLEWHSCVYEEQWPIMHSTTSDIRRLKTVLFHRFTVRCPGAPEPFFNRGSRSKIKFYHVTWHVWFLPHP